VRFGALRKAWLEFDDKSNACCQIRLTLSAKTARIPRKASFFDPFYFPYLVGAL